MSTSASSNVPRWYLLMLGVIFIGYLFLWFVGSPTLQSGYQHPGLLSAPDQLITATSGDSGEYVALATSLLHGHFALPQEAFEYFRTPGYPVFIATVEFLGGSYAAVTLLQILMVFGLAWMVRSLGKRFFNPTIGMLASLLFLLNPVVISLTLQIMSDIPFTFLLLLGITVILTFLGKYSTTSRPIFFVALAGLIFAAASYVRPAGAVMLPVFIAPILIAPIPWVKRFWYSIFLAAVFMLALLPWMLRNYHDSGVFSFSSLAAYNITAYNVTLFQAATHKDSQVVELISMQKTIGIPVMEWRNLSVSASLERYDCAVLLAAPFKYLAFNAFQSTGFFLNSGLELLLSYMSAPFHYSVGSTSQLNLKSLLIHGQLSLFIQTVTTPWWLFAERLFLGAGFCLMLLALYVKRRSAFAWMSVLVILYFAELAGPIAEARYRIPVTPFLELLIAAGLIAAGSLCKKIWE